MEKGIFVTGSGTRVGKTYVCKLLLNGFAKHGDRATYMKPVETGCDEFADGEMLLGDDAKSALGFASCKSDDLSLHSPYRFAPACSPHLAAAQSGRDISIDRIAHAYDSLVAATRADIVVVEGAGGVLVPINDRHRYMVDIAKALSIPALLVVSPGLGTLNHTFMSLRTLEQYGVPVVGIVINNADNVARDFIYDDNVKTIRRHAAPIPCLDIDYNDTHDGILLTELYHEIIYRG